MSEIKAIAYLSRTNKDLTPQEIDKILLDARSFNQGHDITGVLLYNPGFFFQYIEGSAQHMALVYERIKNATSHTIIMELYHDFTDKRYCSDWYMGFCRAPEGFIQELAHYGWREKVHEVERHSEASQGLQMLLKFWNNMASKA